MVLGFGGKDYTPLSSYLLVALVCFLLLFSVPRNPGLLWILLVIIFCLPIKWKRWEGIFRVSLFYLSSLTSLASFMMDYGSIINLYIYIAAILLLISLMTVLILTYTCWKLPILLDVNTCTLALAVIIGALTLPELSDQRYHFLGVLSILIFIFMLFCTCASVRRAEIVSCIEDLEKFKEGLKKLVKDEAKLKLIITRFNEFLIYIETGMFENAYITLSTGLLEAVGIWKAKKDKKPTYERKSLFFKYDKIEHKHINIRGALVHSLPERREKQKHVEDLLKITEDFKRKPFVAICDLLYATKRRIGSSTVN